MTKSRAEIHRQKKTGRGGARPGAGRPAASPRKRLDHQVLVRLNDADQRAVEKVLAAYPEEARPAVATYLREAVRSEVVPPRQFGVIWNADVLIDSSVFGQAALGPGLYRRLALFAHRLTARREFGKVWVPWTALQEMAATPDPQRREVLGVLLNLSRELGDRILLTGPFDYVIAAEWATPPRFRSVSIGQIEDELLACIRGNGAGTQLDEMGRDFGAWRPKQRAQRDELLRKWTERYSADESQAASESKPGKPTARHAIAVALDKVRQPSELYEFCDDLAVQLIKDYARRDPTEGLKLAKAEPEKYLATWTFSLLVRIAQFAQTVPKKERIAGPFGRYAKLLKSHENDIIDATLAALGARCGFLITQDGDLRERINFLFDRQVGRLQAFEFSDIEANWHPPTGYKAE